MCMPLVPYAPQESVEIVADGYQTTIPLGRTITRHKILVDVEGRWIIHAHASRDINGLY
jgi:hypothetical protein